MTLRRELLQNGRIRGRSRLRSLQDGQLQLVEQDVAKLKRGVDVELGTSDAVDVVPEMGQVLVQAPAHLVEEVRVDPDARALHLGEDRDQRRLELQEELHQSLTVQPLRKVLPDPHGQLGCLAREFRGSIRGHVTVGQALLARAKDLAEGGELEAQEVGGQGCQVMLPPAGVQHIRGDHHVPAGAPQLQVRS